MNARVNDEFERYVETVYFNCHRNFSRGFSKRRGYYCKLLLDGSCGISSRWRKTEYF